LVRVVFQIVAIIDFPSFCCNEQNSLQDIKFPPNIKQIGSGAFSKCTNLVSLDLSSYLQLTKFENHAFYNAWALRNFLFPPNIQEISIGSFKNCSNLTQLDMSLCAQMTVLSSYCFSNCFSIREIILPPNIKIIDNNAFENCTNLVSIRIPASVKEIKQNAFHSCIKLREVIFEGDTNVDVNAFQNCPLLKNRLKRYPGFCYGKYSDLKGTLIESLRKRGICGIQLEEFLEDSEITVLPCGHAFFEEALHEWILRRKICPTCRVGL
jgi:hypothetical protein